MIDEPTLARWEVSFVRGGSLVSVVYMVISTWVVKYLNDWSTLILLSMHGSCTRSILYRNTCGPTLNMRCSLAGVSMFYGARCFWLCLRRFNVCVFVFMYSLIFRVLCFVYVICLGVVSFWFGYVGLTVFICVGVVPFTCLFTCCNSVCGACSIWSRVFRICVFSFAFYIFSALRCFLPFSKFLRLCLLYCSCMCCVGYACCIIL